MIEIQEVESSAVCIPNINTSERRQRLAFGGVQLFITLAVLAGMIIFHAGRWWRVLLFPLFGASAAGFFQWRDHT